MILYSNNNICISLTMVEISDILYICYCILSLSFVPLNSGISVLLSLENFILNMYVHLLLLCHFVIVIFAILPLYI